MVRLLHSGKCNTKGKYEKGGERDRERQREKERDIERGLREGSREGRERGQERVGRGVERKRGKFIFLIIINF
jgi:hypothetical protein